MDLKKLKTFADSIKEEDDGVLNRCLLVKVNGVTFEDRQTILKNMDKNSKLKLERDRRNQYDFYAVKVLTELAHSWEHIGFIPKKMSKKIARALDKGLNVSAKIHRLKGGGEGLSWGIDIIVCIERS